jgi:hypothetical protein
MPSHACIKGIREHTATQIASIRRTPFSALEGISPLQHWSFVSRRTGEAICPVARCQWLAPRNTPTGAPVALLERLQNSSAYLRAASDW